jgi:hypothetical protein
MVVSRWSLALRRTSQDAEKISKRQRALRLREDHEGRHASRSARETLAKG